MYKLGAIGLGHWVKRLQHVLKSGNKITLFKAVALKPYDERRDELEFYEIPKERYFSIQSEGNIPEEFFNDLDAVQIASHNKFHFNQVIQCLEQNKLTIVEKTLATSRDEFDKIIQYIRDNNHENKIIPHLHYLTKSLTTELKNMLPALVKDHGKLVKFDATFFEQADEEDAKRLWLFAPEHGGIFMDWIHPSTILVHVLKAELSGIKDVKTYVVRPEYDPVNPTAVHISYRINGDNFSEDAVAEVRIGKGFEIDSDRKIIKLVFEDGVILDLEYISTEEEFATGKRGGWKLYKLRDGQMEILESKSAEGPLSYEILIEEVADILKGGEPMLTLDDIIKIYEPEWKFQEFSKNLQPIRNRDEIRRFITESLININ